MLLDASPIFEDNAKELDTRTKKVNLPTYDLPGVSAKDFEILLQVITYNEIPEVTENDDAEEIRANVELSSGCSYQSSDSRIS